MIKNTYHIINMGANYSNYLYYFRRNMIPFAITLTKDEYNKINKKYLYLFDICGLKLKSDVYHFVISEKKVQNYNQITGGKIKDYVSLNEHSIYNPEADAKGYVYTLTNKINWN